MGLGLMSSPQTVATKNKTFTITHNSMELKPRNKIFNRNSYQPFYSTECHIVSNFIVHNRCQHIAFSIIYQLNFHQLVTERFYFSTKFILNLYVVILFFFTIVELLCQFHFVVLSGQQWNSKLRLQNDGKQRNKQQCYVTEEIGKTKREW